jgi:hypothetical protein
VGAIWRPPDEDAFVEFGLRSHVLHRRFVFVVRSLLPGIRDLDDADRGLLASALVLLHSTLWPFARCATNGD